MDVERLCRRARAGDERALADLCRALHPQLCRFFAALLGGRDGAEDLAQETLLKMLRSLDQYRGLPGSRFESWVFKIGYRVFLDLKRKRREQALGEDYDAPDLAPGPEEAALAGERADRLRGALSLLDEETRAMVLLRYEMELSYSAIARALGTSAPRVKWRLHDALEKLQKTLRAEGFS